MLRLALARARRAAVAAAALLPAACYRYAPIAPADLQPGREVRAELGVAFATERNKQLDADCGSIENVRRIVREAEEEGLLEDDDEDDD